jgi:hypothetical protein
MNSLLKYISKPSSTRTTKCVSEKAYVVCLCIKGLISQKNHLKSSTKTSCGHQEINRNKMKDNNDWIQIFNYRKRKTIDFSSNKQKEKY